jgi:hypothetical protein
MSTGPDWTILVVRRMERFYTAFYGNVMNDAAEVFLEDGWQLRATMETVRPIASTVQWPKDGKLNAKARSLGGVLGHSVAHYHTLCDSTTWRAICERWNTAIELILAKLLPSEDGVGELGVKLEEARLDPDKSPFAAERTEFNKAIACVLRHVAGRSTAEQLHFFEGYTKALRRGSLDTQGNPKGGTTRTPAFQLIAMFGPMIRLHCRSVHDVHRFLEAILGRSRAGTVKRTEAICKSLGMRFRSRGRPSLKTP